MCFYVTLLDCAYFCNEIKKCQLLKSLKYFNILRPLKNNIRLEYILWKNVWFYLLSIVWVHACHKIEKSLDFQSHWNTLTCFHKKSVRFKYVPWEDVWLCFISLVYVNFSQKTEKFRFYRSLKYFNIFFIRFLYQSLILPVPCISESCIEIKIKLNFCFHTSLWCLNNEGL